LELEAAQAAIEQLLAAAARGRAAALAHAKDADVWPRAAGEAAVVMELAGQIECLSARIVSELVAHPGLAERLASRSSQVWPVMDDGAANDEAGPRPLSAGVGRGDPVEEGLLRNIQLLQQKVRVGVLGGAYRARGWNVLE
jgi:hypothetical protein